MRAVWARVGSTGGTGEGPTSLPEVQKPVLGPAAQGRPKAIGSGTGAVPVTFLKMPRRHPLPVLLYDFRIRQSFILLGL